MEQHEHRRSVADLVHAWQDLPVVVLGDVLLDRWRYAEAQRLCRESAAPVVSVRREADAAGGAANVAANLAALGADPLLIGQVGDDEGARRLRECLRRWRVRDALVDVPGRRTVVEHRLVAGDQVLVREEERDPPGGRAGGSGAGSVGGSTAASAVIRALRAALTAAGNHPPVLLIGDYGAGTVDAGVREWLTEHRSAFGFVGLDARDLRRWRGLAPTLVTPNRAEAAVFLGVASGAPGPDPGEATTWAREILRRTGATVASLTLDVDGSVTVAHDLPAHVTRAVAAPAARSVGAGDVFLAAAGLALVVGADPATAADVGQLATAPAVTAVDTCVCTVVDLLRGGRPEAAPDRADDRLLDAAGLAAVVARHRRAGARVVFTNGCFDVLHRGHVAYLAQARRLGDVLVVAVNSDGSVRRLKGPQRPVNPVEDRAAVLAALHCVDHVVVFEEDSPARLIEAVRPDVYAKGGDYQPELVPEAPLVRRLGGEVRVLDYVPDRSTSAVIEQIRASGRTTSAMARATTSPGGTSRHSPR